MACVLAQLALAGRTVEMHGSIHEMVCPLEDCRTVVDMDDTLMKQLLRREDIPCQRCPCTSIRCRIMLYDDKEGAATLNPPKFYFCQSAASCTSSILNCWQLFLGIWEIGRVVCSDTVHAFLLPGDIVTIS